MPRKRVLILDGMWNKSLAAVRSFGKKGFHVTAGERTRFATALFSKYCNRRFIYPSPSEQKEQFLECLENELIRGNYDVIFPMELSTQLLLVSNKKRFLKYCLIPFADNEKTIQIHDKAFLMNYAKDNDIEIPRTYFPESLEQLHDIKTKIDHPSVIKPRMSSGSRGIMYIKNRDELIPAYLKVHREYPVPLIQECIPSDGEAYGVGMLLNYNSEVRASFVYKRIREYPIRGGPSTLRESVKREDILNIAQTILKSLNWTGVAHVEFKVDPRDGRPKLLEVNPRFWGSLQLAIESGIDFPFSLYKMAVDGDIAPVDDYKVGVKCRWIIPGDLLHFLKNPNRFKMKPSFFNFSMKDDILSLHDPMPLLGRISSIFAFFSDKETRNIFQRR